MKIKFGTLAIVALLASLTLAWSQPTVADEPTTTAKPPAGFQLSLVPKDCQDDDGCSACEFVKIFTNAANVIAAVLSTAALVMFVLGGFFLIFSAGVPERVERGKKILIGTVTGLAIVILAWFTVNIIIRISATSGGISAENLTAPPKIFSNEWWNFDWCYQVPTSCVGATVGALCGFGECEGGNFGACICNRSLAPSGDDKGCVEDVTSAGEASSKGKKCACISQCTSYAQKPKSKGFTCVSAATAKNGYAIVGYSCPKTGDVCALKN